MFEKILLPLDGSELAEITIPYGEELASRLGAELILFHVCSPENRRNQHMHAIYLESMSDRVSHQLKKGRPKGKESKVSSEILIGEPVETIVDYVDKNSIGLMIMAASGASGLKLWMLGSVAEKVFRSISIPSMVVRTHDTSRAKSRKKLIGRILVPLDGSDASRHALPVAENMTKALKGRITLFQMARRSYSYVAPEDLGGLGGLTSSKLDLFEERSARANLLSVEKEIREMGIPATHSLASGTDPADEIIGASGRTNADLVVMSTRGRSPVVRWVLGSTAEKVLRQGQLPLVLVR